MQRRPLLLSLGSLLVATTALVHACATEARGQSADHRAGAHASGSSASSDARGEHGERGERAEHTTGGWPGPSAPVSHVSDTPPRVGDRVTLTDAEWRTRLTREQYRVLREQGTERAFTGALWDEHREGTYYCAACGAPLFSSADKFESGTGWPSYTRPIARGRVAQERDDSLGMTRNEVHCARCGGHLGHVFDDGPPPTNQRYCINSVSLEFVASNAAPSHAAREGTR